MGVMNTVMNLLVPEKTGYFFSSNAAASFSRRLYAFNYDMSEGY